MTQVVLSSVNQGVNSYFLFLKGLLVRFNVPLSSVGLPTKNKKLTLLKSPHINKSAREQFQLKVYKKIFYINQDLHSEVFKFIMLNKPKYIKITIRKII